LLLVVITFVVPSFASAVSSNVVVTGSVMEIKNMGDIVISKGNSKVVKNANSITSDMLVYDKKRSIIFAFGNVKLVLKTSDSDSIEAYCGFGKYCINDKSGSLWDSNSVTVKYFIHNLTSPIILHAHKVCVNRKQKVLTAYDDVEVVTSFGTVFSDNAVFDEEMLSVVFRKDRKRPTADVLYGEKKVFCEADEMFFCNFSNKRKIIMSGFVTGKITVKDKI
jgi:lipopolysaccharide assembly outer membrane protein LptD (OstA)